MIVLFTDFGLEGPYMGQMKAVLHQEAPGLSIVDLFADAPVGNPKASAYLLAAYAAWFPAGTVFLCVVDPGVGGTRPAIMLEADVRWYVGPGNGLFELVQRRAGKAQGFDIAWKPAHLSSSFHGRDLFAPVAATLARGEPPPGRPRTDDADRRPDWPDDLAEIVYVDRQPDHNPILNSRPIQHSFELSCEEGNRRRQSCARKTKRRWRVGCSARRRSRWAMNYFGGTTDSRQRLPGLCAFKTRERRIV